MTEQPAADPRQTWNDVGEAFAELGRMIRDRYQEAAADSAQAPFTEEAKRARGEMTDGVRRAIDQLATVARDVGERASDLVTDDDIKVQARQAASSFGEAMTATMEAIVNELGELFRKTKASVDQPKGGPLPAGDKPSSTEKDQSPG